MDTLKAGAVDPDGRIMLYVTGDPRLGAGVQAKLARSKQERRRVAEQREKDRGNAKTLEKAKAEIQRLKVRRRYCDAKFCLRICVMLLWLTKYNICINGSP